MRKFSLDSKLHSGYISGYSSETWSEPMGNTAQKRALRNYRSRLVKRGMARFEVLGLDADRELIRSLAKRLAEMIPMPRGFERPSAGRSRENRQKKAGSSPRYAARRWSGPISISPAHVKPAARSTCDPLSPRHKHHQQCRKACAIGCRCSIGWRNKSDNDLFISALTVGEIRRGLLRKACREKTRRCWKPGLQDRTDHRRSSQAVCSRFDEKAALIWARLMAEGTAKGRPRSGLDMIIASTSRGQ